MKENERRKISRYKTLLNRFKMYIKGEKAYKEDKRTVQEIYKTLYFNKNLYAGLVNNAGEKEIYQIIKKIREKRELSKLEEIAINICNHADNKFYANHSDLCADLQDTIANVEDKLKRMNCAKNEKAKNDIKDIKYILQESSNNIDKSLGEMDAIKNTVMFVKHDSLEIFKNIDIMQYKINILESLRKMSSNEEENKNRLTNLKRRNL